MSRWHITLFKLWAALAAILQAVEADAAIVFNTTVGYIWPPGKLVQFADGNGKHDYLYFQNDGNVVLYEDETHKVLWASNTAGYTCTSTTSSSNSNCNLNWQNDGNFVLYVDGRAIWATNTANKGSKLVISSAAPYVTVYDKSGNYLYPYRRPAEDPDREPKPGPGNESGGNSGLAGLCRATQACYVCLSYFDCLKLVRAS